MLKFNMNIFKSGRYLLALTAALILAAFFLPVSCGYENGLLENLEVAVLACGLISCLRKFYSDNAGAIKRFWLGCGIFYFVMIARELSFGRVFYPVGTGQDGQLVFVKISQLWYGPAVYPAVALLVLSALFCLIRCWLYCRRERVAWNVPVWHFVSFAVLMILSQCVFEKDLIAALKPYGQLLEEAAEISAYCALFCFTHDWSFAGMKRRIG